MRLLITCEHGGNKIPPQYWPLFKKHQALLQTHRGYDPGALALARDFARAFDAELVYSTTSRLLVELNRSPRHPQVLSVATRGLPPEERERLLRRYYWPYRHWVEAQVAAAVEAGESVVHVSSHSFTPKLDGEVRRADVGLLYDPRRPRERELCLAWQDEIRRADPSLAVRRNYPYRGTGDGLTTHLRRLHPNRDYAGIELELNQKHTLGGDAAWRGLRRLMVATLTRALERVGSTTPVREAA
jgi:predicted N-formylglutamate amidohydrolase